MERSLLSLITAQIGSLPKYFLTLSETQTEDMRRLQIEVFMIGPCGIRQVSNKQVLFHTE